jgi:hypothetical protein
MISHASMHPHASSTVTTRPHTSQESLFPGRIFPAFPLAAFAFGAFAGFFAAFAFGFAAAAFGAALPIALAAPLPRAAFTGFFGFAAFGFAAAFFAFGAAFAILLSPPHLDSFTRAARFA